jgi:cell division protein FtsW
VAVAGLVSVGVIMVYSTKVVQGGMQDLIKLGLWLVLGGGAMLVASRVPLVFWKRVAPWLLSACLVMLISLEIPHNPLAYGANGAVRWIRLGGGMTFQPSELAKLAFILFGARFLERRGERMTSKDWLTYLGWLGLLCGIIYKEPDLGTAMVLAGIGFCMLIAAGADWKKLMGLLLVGAAAVFYLAWHTPHQRARLEAWLNPWDKEHRHAGGYQVIQSWTAIARGGWFGQGLGQSIQKLNDRLPEAETDFIFAVVVEELGAIRAMGVLALFALLVMRGYGIAARAPDRYAGLVAAGITSWVAVQSGLNVAVVTGTVPNTGVPLPFISSGGTSLVMLLWAMGILLGISRLRGRKSRTAARSAGA